MSSTKLSEIVVAVKGKEKHLTPNVPDQPEEGNIDTSPAEGNKKLTDISKPYSILVTPDPERIEKIEPTHDLSLPILRKKFASFLMKEERDRSGVVHIGTSTPSGYLDNDMQELAKNTIQNVGVEVLDVTKSSTAVIVTVPFDSEYTSANKAAEALKGAGFKITSKSGVVRVKSESAVLEQNK